MKKKMDYFRQVYKYDNEAKAYIIEASLDDYAEILNGWDPSPVRWRDIEPEFKVFLEECAHDIPLKYPLEIFLYLPESVKNEKKERLTQEAIKNNFEFLSHLASKELRQRNKRSIVYVGMAFIFLSAAYTLQDTGISENVLMSILLEGIFIGGWVFLWEAFSLVFIYNQEVRRNLKEMRRFAKARITFKYEKV
ncbi:MAG: hypothetical protein GT589_09980 [Peptoclostridium sp.]|uniref:hypothetical protein n=1 Tax=Peptoclostridium sp. TaxID=1904860 RepID=UPI00139AD320|nr:hypothetical protein [Peptoclostridium sp.]MZQ76463.1 hypothetical protein [Peptoclostridium sp.]